MTDLKIPTPTYIAYIYVGFPSDIEQKEVATNVSLVEAHQAIRTALDIAYPQAWDCQSLNALTGKPYTFEEFINEFDYYGAAGYSHRYDSYGTLIAEIELTPDSSKWRKLEELYDERDKVLKRIAGLEDKLIIEVKE